MTLQECAQCVAKHGRPGCPATLTDERGLPCCAWCTDSEPCPIEQRRLKAAKKKAPEEPPPTASNVNAEKPATEPKSEVDDMKTLETDAKIAPLICKRPGCEVELSGANRVGLCRAHVRYRDRGNGHAVASSSGVNGSAPKANGHAHAPGNGVIAKTNGHAAAESLSDFSSERVDHLIATLPPADRAKIAVAWLRGQL
jgi:hypothetical protein